MGLTLPGAQGGSVARDQLTKSRPSEDVEKDYRGLRGGVLYNIILAWSRQLSKSQFTDAAD
jgi:hypothetical protein